MLFISGGLALVYELLWIRRFTAVFGATTPAISATLAATFLGFAVGSAVLGTRSTRFGAPLRAYGVLEICVGLSALIVEPLLLLYERVYPQLYSGLSGSAGGFLTVKTLLAVMALFAPSFFMGGTVPALTEGFEAERRRLGISAGGLYAANTLGAVLGALSVPFFWLPNLGADASYRICVVGSVLIGIAAWRMSQGRPVERLVDIEKRPAQKVGALSLLAAVSGVIMFVLQITQGRMFAQVHENSIYSFSVVLAVFLAALAIGAAVARECLRRGASTRLLLGRAWIAAGVAVFVSPHLFYALTDGLTYTSYGTRLLLIALPTVLLPVLFGGMVLPLLMELAGVSTSEPSGRVLGRLLAANTAGTIAGALLGAFVFPRWLGLWGTLAGIGVALIVTGGVCVARGRGAWPAALAASAVAVALWLVWNPAQLPRVKTRQQKHERVLTLRESSHGILAVVEAGADRRITLDNFYVLGGTASAGDERMQAHLPLLLHPSPKKVAFLGLGTGITAGAALLHPVDQITALELVPEVIVAARDYFQSANLGLVGDARVTCIAEDGRNFLRATTNKFDVIVGDLFVPWRRGEAAMFSLDQFLSARRALATGGIYCQWLPLFQMSENEFNIAAATFLEAFPETTLWRGDLAPDLPAAALIGHTDSAPIDPASVERRVRELRRDDANCHLGHSAGLWMFLVGPLDAKESRFATARRNRDARPWLELLGPLAHGGSARGREPLFVGVRLEPFLRETAKRSLDHSPLALLGSEHLAWRDAGARLREAILLSAEGKPTDLREAASALPPSVQQAVLGINPAATP